MHIALRAPCSSSSVSRPRPSAGSLARREEKCASARLAAHIVGLHFEVRFFLSLVGICSIRCSGLWAQGSKIGLRVWAFVTALPPFVEGPHPSRGLGPCDCFWGLLHEPLPRSSPLARANSSVSWRIVAIRVGLAELGSCHRAPKSVSRHVNSASSSRIWHASPRGLRKCEASRSCEVYLDFIT